MRLSLSRRRELRADGTILVFDLSEEPNRVLKLDPDKMLAEEQTLPDTGPRHDPDILKMVADLRDGAAEDLGTKEVDRQPAQGFRAIHKNNDITIWADPQTGLPMRLELRQEQLARTIILSEFDFDVDFDESLFSTTAPEGYTVTRKEQAIKTKVVSPDEIADRTISRTYVFSTDPSWTRKVHIVEITDPIFPGRKMYMFAAIADDGRHLVLAQSQTFNQMLASKIRQGRVIYTSPNGFKVWAGGPEKWYSQILLTSAREIIREKPSEDRVGYALESPDGTFPILAVNGPITDAELHSIADSLIPADRQKDE
jgi:hypothetical protein